MMYLSDVVCSVIERDGNFLIAQRPSEGLLPYKWEFPGGKVEPNECEINALHREIREELSIEIDVAIRLGSYRFEYPDFSINQIAYFCKIVKGDPLLKKHLQFRWISLNEIEQYDLIAANRLILTDIKSFLPML